jgi:cytochrome c553
MSPPSKPDNSVQKKVPGSKVHFTEAGVNDRFNVPDWFPGDHPPLPEVVARGKPPKVFACGYCHLPNGQGRPENAPLAGQPGQYIIEQVTEMKEGRRKTSSPTMGSIKSMYQIAAAVRPEDLKVAADYFSRLKYKKWIKVVETDTVPKTRLSVGMYLPLEGNEKEPLGQRIIETPEQPDATEMLRDPRSGFIAYVPFGSIKKGEALVTQGGAGKTVACAVCHGADLKGLGPVPGIAGRSPSYLVRQLYDMQQNTRKGEWTELMKPVVSRLTEEDMLNIAAYTSSRTP